VQFHVGHAFHDCLDLLTSLLNLSDQEVCLTMSKPMTKLKLYNPAVFLTHPLPLACLLASERVAQLNSLIRFRISDMMFVNQTKK
jgi:hypothetical protein